MEEQEERLRVYVTDVRNSRLFYCPAMRHWFPKYGMSFNDFITIGIDAEELLTKSNNDDMAVRAVAEAKARRAEGIK